MKTSNLSLILIGLMVLIVSGPASAVSPAKPPNIVLVLVDDLGWMDLSCQGLSHEPVISVDYVPTILEAAHIAKGSQAIDGVSLMNHLRTDGTASLQRDAIYWHFPHYRHDPGPYSIIRSGDWKLIRYYEGIRELYNLKEDLAETKNLAQDLPDKVRALDAQLTQHLEDVGAKLPSETQPGS